jgi:hypothetical protein
MSEHGVAHLLAMFLLSVVPLSGCADHSGLSGWEAAGWRLGWVNQIVERKDLKEGADLACIHDSSPDGMTSGRFAVVWYSQTMGSRRRSALTVPIPDFLDLKVGDAVQINVLDCKKPISRYIG